MHALQLASNIFKLCMQIYGIFDNGTLGPRDLRPLDFGFMGLWDLWTMRLWDHGTLGPLDIRSIGHLDNKTSGDMGSGDNLTLGTRDFETKGLWDHGTL